jgi:hypothetical protein
MEKYEQILAQAEEPEGWGDPNVMETEMPADTKLEPSKDSRPTYTPKVEEPEHHESTNINWDGDPDDLLAEYLSNRNKDFILGMIRNNYNRWKFRLKDQPLRLIPDKVYKNLPQLLKTTTGFFSDPHERAMFLTSVIVLLSGCFDQIKGRYRKETVHANLFGMIIAPSASKKGVMGWARKLLTPFHQSRLQVEVDHKDNSVEESLEPLGKNNDPYMLFLPANSTPEAAIMRLDQNNGSAIICETEADAMGNRFSQKGQNYSDLARSAFHHEPIAYNRKKDQEYRYIDRPRLSILMTGTPGQIKRVIPSEEDGSFSRFIFYQAPGGVPWDNVSPDENGPDLEARFAEIGNWLVTRFNSYGESPVDFVLSQAQWQELNEQQSRMLNDARNQFGFALDSSVIRLGLITFRIAMVLSIIRQLTSKVKLEPVLTCNEKDFTSALDLGIVYFAHTREIYKLHYQSKGLTGKHQKLEAFLDSLPSNEEFPRSKAVEVGGSVGISDRSVANYLSELIKQGLLTHKYGKYQKTH